MSDKVSETPPPYVKADMEVPVHHHEEVDLSEHPVPDIWLQPTWDTNHKSTYELKQRHLSYQT